MQIGFAQINTTVGDIRSNQERIFSAYETAVSSGADLVLTPELALTGYPPQDMVFKSGFVPETLESLNGLRRTVGTVPLLVGYVDFNPSRTGKPFVNACAVLAKGEPVRKVFKTLLPTYDVFDEARYFDPAPDQEPIDLLGTKIGITICEDIWTDKYLKRDLYRQDPVLNLASKGARAILNLSSSPYSVGKPALRREMVSELAATYRVPFYYCNGVGGNDELIFDGNSFAIDAAGKTIFQMRGFREEISVARSSAAPLCAVDLLPEQEIYEALVLGVRDYFSKCGFKSAVLGLSGGIDSAVTAAVAVAALGKENVVGVSMPSQYSSQGSLDDAADLAKNLGIVRHVISIKEPFDVLKSQFKEIFAGRSEDTTEENMQSRLRGLTLMSMSNKFGHLRRPGIRANWQSGIAQFTATCAADWP
jgi:predicted amidohydrolase